MKNFKEGDSLEQFPEGFGEEYVTVIGLMEKDKQALNLYEFFEELVKKGEIARAQKIAWALWFQYRIDVDGLFN